MRLQFLSLSVLAAATFAANAVEPAALVRSGPNPDAPKQVQEYGQLEGSWTCRSSALQPDGSWKQSPGENSWSWYYVLDGYGVLDVWQPDRSTNPKAAIGINLRTYDPESQTWDVVWTTQTVPRFDRYRSAERNGDLHIYAERPANGKFPSHLMHITFYNIGAEHYDWKYESSGLTDGQNWQETNRLSCDRLS